jgi:hypothetical protein
MTQYFDKKLNIIFKLFDAQLKSLPILLKDYISIGAFSLYKNRIEVMANASRTQFKYDSFKFLSPTFQFPNTNQK